MLLLSFRTLPVRSQADEYLPVTDSANIYMDKA
jgi:hypothetical protein